MRLPRLGFDITASDYDWAADEQQTAVSTENEESVRAPRKPKAAARPFKKQGMRPTQRRERWGKR